MARHHARYYYLMAVWRERFGDRFFDIAYEDTARDVEPNARALVEFLELPWEDACLEFHKQDAAVTTASAVSDCSNKGGIRATMNTPAVTMVAA